MTSGPLSQEHPASRIPPAERGLSQEHPARARPPHGTGRDGRYTGRPACRTGRPASVGPWDGGAAAAPLGWDCARGSATGPAGPARCLWIGHWPAGLGPVSLDRPLARPARPGVFGQRCGVRG